MAVPYGTVSKDRDEMTNSVDPDQTVPGCTCTLFAQTCISENRIIAVLAVSYQALTYSVDRNPGLTFHSVEQIRRVFDDNLGIIFIISP